MNAGWKHRKDEDNVEVLLRRITHPDRGLVASFPRDVEAILCSALSVSVERVRGLTERSVGSVLATHYGVDFDGDDQTPLAGFTYARGELIVVFLDPSFGPDAERFTLGHEAGHIVVEHLPRVAGAGQQNLFGANHDVTLFAHRDPPGNMFLGASGQAAVREVVANGFAAELISPHREVRRLLVGVPDEAACIEKVRASFGLSKTAARIRVSELGLARPSAGGLVFD